MTEAVIRDRIESKLTMKLRTEEEKRKCGGLALPDKKMYAIDKIVRKKLQEKSGEANYSDLIDPIVNERYDVMGLGPGPDEAEEPSVKVEETKGEPSHTESRDISSQKAAVPETQKTSDAVPPEPEQETHQESESSIKRLTYEEWLDKKEAEAQYWKLLVEAEREEMIRMEEQKQQEKLEMEEQK